MGLKSLEARIVRRAIYSMETIANIILLPWTLLEWGFSIVAWYIIFSMISNKLWDYGIDRHSVVAWFQNTWDDLLLLLKWRRD
jgi:hypothetical protein